jgi:hypothetical protein
MKFMVTWEIHPDKRMDIWRKWCSMTPEERADQGEGVTLICRWHNTAEMKGVAVYETDDPTALGVNLGLWNPAMDLVISPVVDDEESAAIGKKILEAMGG